MSCNNIFISLVTFVTAGALSVSCVQILDLDPGHHASSGGAGPGTASSTVSTSMATTSVGGAGGAGGAGGGVAATRIENFSMRSFVDTGEAVSKVQFTVEGSGMKCVLINGLGPSLGALGVPPPLLADPTIDLSTNPMLPMHPTTIAVNNDWMDTQEALIVATGKAPTNPSESAIYQCLGPGPYIATLQGTNGGTGEGLLEMFDLDDPTSMTSTLTLTAGQGETSVANPVSCGLTIDGAVGSSLKIVATALGPSLMVANPITDPVLEFHHPPDAVIKNDDWGTGMMDLGTHAPSKPQESALAETLGSGSYTFVVYPHGAEVGITQVQVFNDGPP
jgi:hypothetical protein